MGALLRRLARLGSQTMLQMMLVDNLIHSGKPCPPPPATSAVHHAKAAYTTCAHAMPPWVLIAARWPRHCSYGLECGAHYVCHKEW